MRLNRLLDGSGWRYALGEVLLIVVGISIALALDSWRIELQDRSDELRVLNQFRQVLIEDVEGLIEQESRMQNVEVGLETLLAQIQNGEPYDEEMGQRFRLLWRFSDLVIRTAPFEDLKSRGLDLISNEDLRMDLLSLYEDLFPDLEGSGLSRREIAIETARPFLLENFRQRESLAWEPVDLDQLRTDGYVANLCSVSLQMLRRLMLPKFSETIAETQSIIEAIDAEISD